MSVFLVGHATTPDKLKLITSAAGDIDTMVSYIDYTDADPPVVVDMNNESHTITTAATTDILAGVTDAAKRRVFKNVSIVNTHATISNNVSVILDDIDASDYQIAETITLAPGEAFKYDEGHGWFKSATPSLLDTHLYVTADYINATTSFTDITGLTVPVLSGKHYCFEAHLYHIENASTTGAQFAINGPTMTLMQLQEIGGFAGAVGAGTMQCNVGSVAALDTAAIAATSSAGTPQVVMAILSGYINPSAAGTFAMRGKSEVAVAAGLTVKKGSWLHLFEVPES